MKTKLKARRCLLAFGSCLLVAAVIIGLDAGTLAACGEGSVDAKAMKAAKEWLARPENPLPDEVLAAQGLSRRASSNVATALWREYQSNSSVSSSRILPEPTVVRELRNMQLTPGELKTGDKTMPFVFLQRGKKTKQMPLFIALHGGGGAKVDGPHAWPVNTREWQTQAQLAATLYPDNALYFVPRMADDRDGRWYYSYCQDAYDQVIRDAIRHHDVDPNRIYLIGISEGAYTAYRLGAFMADRWAGAGSMAGGEPLGNAPPENMRNLAFRADIGERDTMYDRLGLNKRYGEALADLKKEDSDGFEYMIQVHQGRGHGIDYRGCAEWIYGYERDPWPSRVHWVNIDVHGRRRMQTYWLALDQAPEGRVEFDAEIDRESNSVSVSVLRRDGEQSTPDNSISFRVYLNDEMLDLDRPVRVIRNGIEVSSAKVDRALSTMLQSLVERGDPNYCFPAMVQIDGK